MTNRRRSAIARLRDRLRVTAGDLATITAGDTVIATDVSIVPIDVVRAIRNRDDVLLEDDDRAFLVGVDDVADDPAVGWLIVTNGTSYRVTERPELESCWRWHDTAEVQRVIFCKQWSAPE